MENAIAGKSLGFAVRVVNLYRMLRKRAIESAGNQIVELAGDDLLCGIRR